MFYISLYLYQFYFLLLFVLFLMFFFKLNLFFKFAPQHLISFNFCIQSGSYFFILLIYFIFQFRPSLFYFIYFYTILGTCSFGCYSFFLIIFIDYFFFLFHPLIFERLRILFRDFFFFHGVILVS